MVRHGLPATYMQEYYRRDVGHRSIGVRLIGQHFFGLPHLFEFTPVAKPVRPHLNSSEIHEDNREELCEI